MASSESILMYGNVVFMWIVTQYQGNQEETEHFLDLLLKISPDIYLPSKTFSEEGFVFLYLSPVSQYWKVENLKDPTHPLKELLESLSQKMQVRFVVAPSAPWAYFLFKIRPHPTSFFQIFSREDCSSFLSFLSPAVASHFIPDFFSDSKSAAISEWNFFVDSLEALGFKNCGLFLHFFQDPDQLSQATERLGLIPKKLLERIRFKDDLSLKLYTPPLQLRSLFYPDIEKQIDSPSKPDILERLKEVLETWEERLRLRKSLIRGFEVVLISNRRHCKKHLCLTLPRPTRDAQSLFKLLQEKWLSSTHHFSEPETDLKSFVFEEVAIYSLGLQFESDRQLHLFDPKREDRQEEWSLLIGTLYSLGSDVRVGHYAAHESYWPEFSVEWKSWSDSDFIAPVEDHPKRPLVLLSPPRAFKEAPLQSEEDFLNFLAEHKCFESLERISEPWRGEERSYARLGQQWIFWDHKKKGCFVHGLNFFDR